MASPQQVHNGSPVPQRRRQRLVDYTQEKKQIPEQTSSKELNDIKAQNRMKLMEALKTAGTSSTKSFGSTRSIGSTDSGFWTIDGSMLEERSVDKDDGLVRFYLKIPRKQDRAPKSDLRERFGSKKKVGQQKLIQSMLAR